MQDQAREHALWRILKFASKRDYENDNPYEISRFEGNILLNEGINELWKRCCGSEGTPWDEANAFLGVGDSDTTEAATQTGLQAASNKTFKEMDSGFPTYGTNQKVTFQATFGTAEANFAWKEFTVVNSNDDSGVNLNRKVSDQGTKTLAEIWELTLEIMLS